jgi:hypothetical protein
MTFVYTDGGRNFFENAITDSSFTETINTVAIGDGSSAPSTGDTSLDNQLYEEDDTASNVTIERGGADGEIRATVEFTGGTEVLSDSEIQELAFKSSAGTLVYREVRPTPITVLSGETKIVEIQMFVEDNDTESDVAVTTDGINYIADRAVGDATDTIDTIAVGDGTGNVSQSDTSLDNELYRNSDSGSNTIVATTTNVGQVRAEMTLGSGNGSGDEVAADASISEFGLITSGGTLVLHEKRSPVILEENDTKTFKIPFSIIQ